MNGKKIYQGRMYHFTKGKFIGRGGNGAVYEVQTEKILYPVVAKFFEYDGKNKEKRYERFKKEIESVHNLREIEGIMPILDENVPTKVPDTKDEAWFLMPKAECYKVNRKHNLIEKIDEMLILAKTIEKMHDLDYAHRDIKPENILIYNDKPCLSDLGLIWQLGEERITDYNERIGPYKIMPPELEHIHFDLNIDFRFSDVYLFAKVLWMTLKGDNYGFRGQYKRDDIQIYLNKDSYKILTLEPIHKLMEEATCEDIKKRISIKKCVAYLESQKEIILMKKDEISSNFIHKLQYEENTKKIIAENEPNELIYEDKDVIYEMIKSIISIAVVKVRDSQEDTEISVSNFKVKGDGTCEFSNFVNGKLISQYLVRIKKMTYLKQNNSMTIELSDINVENKKYISFVENKKRFHKMNSKIYLNSSEKIIICKSELL